MALRASVVLVALVLVGCGGEVVEHSGSESQAERGEVADPEVPAGGPEGPVDATPDPFRAGDEWQGTYTCPQGLTHLDLRIVSTHADEIDDALFIFDWSTGGVTGSFHMHGAYERASGALALEPDAWASYPGPGWFTVAMSGKATDSAFNGTIDSPGCGTFQLTK